MLQSSLPARSSSTALCFPPERRRSCLDGGRWPGRPLPPRSRGMVPPTGRCRSYRWSAPRTCGDGPWPMTRSVILPLCSLYPQGRCVHRKPAIRRRSASYIRGDGPGDLLMLARSGGCSPCLRGWSVLWSLRSLHRCGECCRCTDHAGGLLTTALTIAVPPLAGDGPSKLVSPLIDRIFWETTTVCVCGGWSPSIRARPTTQTPAPHTCGDGPTRCALDASAMPCSPLPRGWPDTVAFVGLAQRLLLAPAWGWPHRTVDEGGLRPLLPASAGLVPA